MTLRPSIWGALIGAAIAFAVLGYAAYALLSTDGNNYRVLVAVWLWLLPALGIFSGGGYAIGLAAEALERAEARRDG